MFRQYETIGGGKLKTYEFSKINYIKNRWQIYLLWWLASSCAVSFLIWLNNKLTYPSAAAIFLFALIVAGLCLIRKIRILQKSYVEISIDHIKYVIVNKAGIDVAECVFDQFVYNISKINRCDTSRKKVIIYGDIKKQTKHDSKMVPSVIIPMFFANSNELQSQIIRFKEKLK